MSRLLLVAALALAAFPAFSQNPARLRAASPASIQEPNAYWPLAAGNVWTYIETSQRWFDSEPQQIRVAEQETHNNTDYFRVVEMFGREGLLRMSPRGQILEWVPEQGAERLWYDFSLPAGGAWQPDNGDQCAGRAVVTSRGETVQVRAGTFENSLTIQYSPGPCADAGVTEEVFAPGVGLIRRTITTIAGPRTFELSDARIGGKALQGPGLSFGLSVDRVVYTPDLTPPTNPDRAVPTLEATIFVENSTSQPLTLRFSSGQQFDLEIRNAAGDGVYRWSANRTFLQALTTIELSPGRKVFTLSVPLGDVSKAAPLPAGRYVVEAWLTTAGEKVYSASAPIEITEPTY